MKRTTQHWPKSQMLSRKPCTLSKEEEVAVEVVAGDEEGIAEAEEVVTGAPRCGAAGVA